MKNRKLKNDIFHLHVVHYKTKVIVSRPVLSLELVSLRLVSLGLVSFRLDILGLVSWD